VSCEKPPWEQPQPMNVYPVTLGGPTVDPNSCAVPAYEQPQAPNVYPVTQGVSSSVGPPTGRLCEVIDGIPGSLRGQLETLSAPVGRLSEFSAPVGQLTALP